MKRTFRTLVALVISVFLIVGCTMKQSTGFVISRDGEVTVKLIMAMDNEMIDTYLTLSEDSSLQNAMTDENFNPDDIKVKEHTDEQRWAFFESDEIKESFNDFEGFESAKYDEGGFKGYVYSRKLGKLDEISTTSATERVVIGDSDSDFNSVFVKDGDVYKSNMKVDSQTEISDDTTSQISQLGGIVDISLVIELPVKPISDNADKKSDDGRTLTWDLTKPKDIDVEFDLTKATASDDNEKSDAETTGAKDTDKKKDSKKDSDDEKSNLILYIGIGAGVLILLVVIIAIVVASKKKKTAQPETIQPAVMTPSFEQPAAPAEPAVAPVQPVAQPAEPAVAPVQQPAEQPVDPNQPQQ